MFFLKEYSIVDVGKKLYEHKLSTNASKHLLKRYAVKSVRYPFRIYIDRPSEDQSRVKIRVPVLEPG